MDQVIKCYDVKAKSSPKRVVKKERFTVHVLRHYANMCLNMNGILMFFLLLSG